MKEQGHPKTYKVIYHDTSSGAEFISHSTKKGDSTKKIGDIEYQVIKVETSSASHPFYTGNMKAAVVGGQVDRFKKKMAEAQKKQAERVKYVKGKKKGAANDIADEAEAA